ALGCGVLCELAEGGQACSTATGCGLARAMLAAFPRSNGEERGLERAGGGSTRRLVGLESREYRRGFRAMAGTRPAGSQLPRTDRPRNDATVTPFVCPLSVSSGGLRRGRTHLPPARSLLACLRPVPAACSSAFPSSGPRRSDRYRPGFSWQAR